MNKTKMIIKRIYFHQDTFNSIYVIPRIHPDEIFKQIPRCHECVHFSFYKQTCKKFFCKAYIARLNTFKCGFFGKYFIPRL